MYMCVILVGLGHQYEKKKLFNWKYNLINLYNEPNIYKRIVMSILNIKILIYISVLIDNNKCLVMSIIDKI